MPTIPLPGGHSAELRDKVTIRGRELVQLESADVMRLISERWPDLKPEEFETVNPLEGGRELILAFRRLNRAVVVALLKSWTLPDPLPTVDDPGDVDADVFEALQEAVAPRVGEVAGFTAPENAKDPSTPPVPSSVFGGGGLAQITPTTNRLPGSSTPGTSTTSALASP